MITQTMKAASAPARMCLKAPESKKPPVYTEHMLPPPVRTPSPPRERSCVIQERPVKVSRIASLIIDEEKRPDGNTGIRLWALSILPECDVEISGPKVGLKRGTLSYVLYKSCWPLYRVLHKHPVQGWRLLAGKSMNMKNAGDVIEVGVLRCSGTTLWLQRY